ncbi:MAG: malto-oligosyltrehalose synthase [Firmicutes bacterium]|nr:malto-oligosyltrehalose synthase [Bacillota bacterium]
MTLRVPAATYRLQFTGEFGFHEAAALIPYLDALGITDLYASPLLQAREGSEHGYDVTDPRRLDSGVGGRVDFAGMSAALKDRRMGLLLDIVPNHMAASPENPWWRDVLRWGPNSIHAAKFDIDWEAKQEQEVPTGKLILPILGAPLCEVLENGEIKLALGSDGFQLHYQEQHLPVCPDSYQFILTECMQNEVKTPGERIGSPAALKAATGGKKNAAPLALIEGNKNLWELYLDEEQVREFIDRVLEFWNERAEKARFKNLMDRQHYRLVYWKEDQHKINYRRFFDINDLVSLRIEDEAVFQEVHARVLELARAGAVTGLRIDHIDGLNDPEGYLVRLQNNLQAHEPDHGSPSTIAPGEIKGKSEPPFYVVVEKILGENEELPNTWPVSGTTGYDFANILNGLFVDARGLEMLEDFYTRVTGIRTGFSDLVNTTKRQVMQDLFRGEIEDLSEELARLAAQDPQAREIAPEDLTAALTGITAAFPVYRTYTRGFSVAPADAKYIEEALNRAASYGDGSEQARAFLRRLLLLEFDEHMSDETRNEWLGFVMRWQQFTGPIMAKGFEDTALYLYNRLISLNEVGGDPARGSVSLEEFHKRMQSRCAHFPHTMNATSTHDTKRSEDVRARINVLSELPEAWAQRVGQWQEWNASKKLLVAGKPAPDNNVELLLYQTLIGAWPLREEEETDFIKRLKEYLVKACREMKVDTSWLDPDEEYEGSLSAFVRRILEDSADDRFRRDFRDFLGPVAYYGALNSLAQVVLKVVCPGVPDFFMGNELWNFSLVDPDNRRPVDFEQRIELLKELQQREVGRDLACELLKDWDNGRIKLYVTWKALELRRSQAALFASGAYLPLKTAGPAQEHLCALARHTEENWVIAAVPRLSLRMITGGDPAALPEIKPPVGTEFWAGTVLFLPAAAPARWRNIFTGEIVNSAPAAVGNMISDSAESSVENAANGQILPLEKMLDTFPVGIFIPD